jgi:hypothetical protein
MRDEMERDRNGPKWSKSGSKWSKVVQKRAKMGRFGTHPFWITMHSEECKQLFFPQFAEGDTGRTGWIKSSMRVGNRP